MSQAEIDAGGGPEGALLPGNELGDLNADGSVDLVDSTILRRVLAGEPVPH